MTDRLKTTVGDDDGTVRRSTRERRSIPVGTFTADGDDLLEGFGPDDLVESLIFVEVRRD